VFVIQVAANVRKRFEQELCHAALGLAVDEQAGQLRAETVATIGRVEVAIDELPRL
jgi:hypothetical protein